MNINLQKFIEKQMLASKQVNEDTNVEQVYVSQACKWLEKFLSKNQDKIVAAYEKTNTVGGNRGEDMVKLINSVCIGLDKKANGVVESAKVNEDEATDINEDDDASLDEGVLNEDDDISEAAEEKTMSEEELKIESLKIATNIAKLMSDVTTDDIITIADKVAGFIRDHSIGSDDSAESLSDEGSEDLGAGLDLDSENSEEKSEEEENKE